MVIYVSAVGDTCTLDLQGRLTAADAPQLQAELAKNMKNASTVVLDCENLEYIASAGLRQLMIAEKYMEAKKGALILKHVNENVMMVLEETGFDTILTVEK